MHHSNNYSVQDSLTSKTLKSRTLNIQNFVYRLPHHLEKPLHARFCVNITRIGPYNVNSFYANNFNSTKSYYFFQFSYCVSL